MVNNLIFGFVLLSISFNNASEPLLKTKSLAKKAVLRPLNMALIDDKKIRKQDIAAISMAAEYFDSREIIRSDPYELYELSCCHGRKRGFVNDRGRRFNCSCNIL